jgi:hypothetical protein
MFVRTAVQLLLHVVTPAVQLARANVQQPTIILL